MKCVVCHFEAEVNNQVIVARVSKPELYDGPYPHDLTEQTKQSLQAMNERQSGAYDLSLRLGCGIMPQVSLDLLKTPEPDFWEKIGQKFGEVLLDPVVAGLYRDTGARGTWNCVDQAFGIPYRLTIPGHACGELAEFGPFCDKGWAKYRLQGALAPFQSFVAEAQTTEWNRLRPGWESCGEVVVEPVAGHDTIEFEGFDQMVDGKRWSVLLRFEPTNQAMEIGFPARLLMADFAEQSPDGRWQVRDTEHRKAGDDWIPLNRRPAFVCGRKDCSPIVMFADGALDGTVAPIELDTSANRAHAVNEKTAGAMGLLHM